MDHPVVDTQKYAIILFDGMCNFCNKSVQFIIQRDGEGYFRFASLQSSIAESLLSNSQMLSSRLSSIVLIEGERYFTESTAVLRICKNIGGLWRGLYALIIIPKAIRDPLYRWFARHRYTFFGKKETCMVPAPEIRERFLEIDKEKGVVSNE